MTTLPASEETVPATDAEIKVPTRVTNIKGEKFNKLTAISYLGVQGKAKHARWLFKCDCGNDYIALALHVKSGSIKGCGCLHKNTQTTHGDSKSRTYRIYYGMMERCYKENRAGYKRYGAIGITVCERWREGYDNFIQDMGPCPDGMSLDRINPFGNYEPSNCAWSYIVEQNNNRRYHWLAFAKAEREKAIRECAEIALAMPKLRQLSPDHVAANTPQDVARAILSLSQVSAKE